jgi:hypothetical protein
MIMLMVQIWPRHSEKMGFLYSNMSFASLTASRPEMHGRLFEMMSPLHLYQYNVTRYEVLEWDENGSILYTWTNSSCQLVGNVRSLPFDGHTHQNVTFVLAMKGLIIAPVMG